MHTVNGQMDEQIKSGEPQSQQNESEKEFDIEKMTKEELKKVVGSLLDEVDGTIMRCQSYEAKINALIKRTESQEKSIRTLEIQARMAERFAMKIVNRVLAQSKKEVADESL